MLVSAETPKLLLKTLERIVRIKTTNSWLLTEGDTFAASAAPNHCSSTFARDKLPLTACNNGYPASYSKHKQKLGFDLSHASIANSSPFE